jgi:hypothetical protein
MSLSVLSLVNICSLRIGRRHETKEKRCGNVFEYIPEPTTFLLLGVGDMMMRSRKSWAADWKTGRRREK